MAKQSAKNLPGSFPAKIKDWHALLFITAAVVIFFRDILLQRAFLWEDFIYQFSPFRTFAAVSLANGELPLWNPYTFNGLPFQADIQSALFYIPNLLLTLFVSGDRLPLYWLEVSIVLHYILAGAGMYYLAKNFGLEPVYALFSGLIYALCGYMIAHAIHQVIINQVAWIPLIVLLFRKAIKEFSPLAMILAGLVLGHAILAGFPQVTLYIFFFLLLIFLFEFFTTVSAEGLTRAIRQVPIASGVVVLALALPAVQLLPTIELAPLSQRAELTYEKSLESSMYWEQLITILVPNFFGTRGAQESTFWLANEYSLYWETCFYLGVVSLLLLAFAVPLARSDRRIAFLFAVMVFSLLYALGDRFVLHKLFFTYVPGFGTFRSIGRITLLLSIAGSLLAGFGLRNLFALAQTNQRLYVRILAFLAGGAIVIWLAVHMGFLQPSGPGAQQIREIASSATTTNTVLLLVVCTVAYLFVRKSLSQGTVVVGFLAVHLIDIHVFGFEQNNGTVNPDDYFRQASSTVNLLKEEGKNEFFRINSRQGGAMILDRNQGMLDRIFLMEGYTPLALQRMYPPGKNWDRICDLMNVKYRLVVDEQQRTMGLRQAQTYLPRAYMVYSTTVFRDDDSVKAFMEREDFDPRRVVVLEEDPPFPLDTAVKIRDWSASITSYSLNALSLQVSTPTDGILVLSEIYYPGWNAYVDGRAQQVYRANWNLRAIALRAGSHSVELRFEPNSLSHGAVVSALALGLSIAGIVYLKVKSRNQAG